MLKPPRRRRRRWLRRNNLFAKNTIPLQRLLVVFYMVAYSLINLTITMGDVDYDWLHEFLKAHTIQEDLQNINRYDLRRKWANAEFLKDCVIQEKKRAIQENIEYNKKLDTKRRWAVFFVTSFFISLTVIKEIFKL